MKAVLLCVAIVAACVVSTVVGGPAAGGKFVSVSYELLFES